ncbi:MAG TPA: MarR family transcriptional regulator [Candidatus Scatomonas pullistercoris]|uniref:MarR family transcriptional regulator n=1 Tax=Candidatus Scatomonas pullistercoris TaxID=2840920 RepID=A0A9D1P1T6_9FIRM|nr:MarR family transcriptional regulator [Candidatus Scatomonas pullistercoris]
MDYSLITLLHGMKFRKLLETLCRSLEEQYGLNKTELQILFYLHTAGGKNTCKDIMELKLFTRGHISQALGHLMKKGYVVIVPDEKDRRYTHNYLTDQAGTLAEELRKIFRRARDILMQGLTEEEKRILVSAAKKINKNIDQATGGKERAI